MGKLEIVCQALGVIFVGVGLTVALTVAQEAWKSNEHVRGLWWSALVAQFALIGMVAIALPIAYRSDAEKRTQTRDDPMRPFVGVASTQPTLEIGKPIAIVVKFTNTGKSPAYRVEAVTVFEKISITDRIKRDYEAAFKNASRGDIAAGDSIISTRQAHEWTLDELMALTTDRSHKIVTHGVIRYRSKLIAAGIDETPFCFEFNPDIGDMIACRKSTLPEHEGQ